MVDSTFYDQFLARFGPGTKAPATWPAAWDAAMAAYPGEPLPFLTEEFLSRTGPMCGLADEVFTELRQAAVRIRSDPLLSRIAWFLRRIYLRAPMPAVAEVGTWPFNARPLPEPAAMIPALVVLAGTPGLRDRHQARKIPEEITRATLGDLEIWIRQFRRANGFWGLQNLAWLSRHLNGQLIRLGRLQFQVIGFNGPVRVFAHRETGRAAALCAPGIALRRDGLVNGTNGVSDDQVWTSTFASSGHGAVGQLIDPRGFVLRETVTLPAADWPVALAPGDPVLDIHIPEGGPMDFAACGESMRQALEFFPCHFPDLIGGPRARVADTNPTVNNGRDGARPSGPMLAAFVCVTWFFDVQYQQLLPATSNMVRFQREFYLYPVMSDDREPFWRVFGEVPRDLAKAPRDSSLRRAMLDFKMAGGQLRGAGGFCLVAGWRWGSQRYQVPRDKPERPLFGEQLV